MKENLKFQRNVLSDKKLPKNFLLTAIMILQLIKKKILKLPYGKMRSFFEE